MVNRVRRQTLKSLGGLAASVAATSSLGMSSARAMSELSALVPIRNPLPPAVPRKGELSITLVDSLDFRRSTLMMSNTSHSTITVSRLLPGNIIVYGNHLDCRQALAGGPVTLAPGKTFTTEVMATALDQHKQEIVEYLDANASLSHLSLGSKVVSLGGFLVDDAAVLYNDTAPELASLPPV